MLKGGVRSDMNRIAGCSSLYVVCRHAMAAAAYESDLSVVQVPLTLHRHVRVSELPFFLVAYLSILDVHGTNNNEGRAILCSTRSLVRTSIYKYIVHST